jgi:hypothetical protein
VPIINGMLKICKRDLREGETSPLRWFAFSGIFASSWPVRRNQSQAPENQEKNVGQKKTSSKVIPETRAQEGSRWGIRSAVFGNDAAHCVADMADALLRIARPFQVPLTANVPIEIGEGNSG